MINRMRRLYLRPAGPIRLSTLSGVVASVLLVATRLSAQVTANPALAIFSAPGATVVFTISVPPGTTLNSFSVLALGATNLDFNPVAAGTTCPGLVAGACKIEVQFQPTAPGRRQGAVVLNDPGGNPLLSVSLDGAGSGPLLAFGPGIISTFAGKGTGGDNGPAVDALLAGPTGIAVDGFGNHYIADPMGNKVRKVTSSGVISTFAGTGAPGYSGDGGPATSAALSGPMSVLVDGAGFVYIADTGNNVVRMVDPAGTISTYAGQYYAPGTTPPAVCAAATNSVGDGCPGNQMVMNEPVDLVFCHAQNIHISDRLNNRVRTIMRTTYQTITQVGNGIAGYNGDGELNTSAELNGPTGMAMDAANYIYVADTGNHIIRKTLLTGTIPNPISTIAGTPGSAGTVGDDGPAIAARLSNPHGVQVDPAGDVYIADSDGHVVRKVDVATGLISTIVGSATAGYAGDGSSATGAQLNAPTGILLDEVGDLYIADSQSAAIRKVDVSDGPSLAFAAAAVGATSAAQDLTLMNLGTSPLMIHAISATAGYSLGGSDTSCELLSDQTLSPATSCILGIEFTPMTAGLTSGTIVLTDNANPASQTVALSGTAVAADGGTTADAGTPADGGAVAGSDGGAGQALHASGCTTAGGSAALWGLLAVGLMRRRQTRG